MEQERKIVDAIKHQKLEEVAILYREANQFRARTQYQVYKVLTEALVDARKEFRQTLQDLNELKDKVEELRDRPLSLARSLKLILMDSVKANPNKKNPQQEQEINMQPKTIGRIKNSLATETKKYKKRVQQKLIQLEELLQTIQAKGYLIRQDGGQSGSVFKSVRSPRSYTGQQFSIKQLQVVLQEERVISHLRSDFLNKFSQLFFQQSKLRGQIYHSFQSNLENFHSCLPSQKSGRVLGLIELVKKHTKQHNKSNGQELTQIQKLQSYVELGETVQKHYSNLVTKFREIMFIREWKVKISKYFIVQHFTDSTVVITLEGRVLATCRKSQDKQNVLFNFDCRDVKLETSKQDSLKVQLSTKKIGSGWNKAFTILFLSEQSAQEFCLHAQKWI